MSLSKQDQIHRALGRLLGLSEAVKEVSGIPFAAGAVSEMVINQVYALSYLLESHPAGAPGLNDYLASLEDEPVSCETIGGKRHAAL